MRRLKIQLGISAVFALLALLVAAYIDGKFTVASFGASGFFFIAALLVSLALDIASISKTVSDRRAIQSISNPILREHAKRAFDRSCEVLTDAQGGLVVLSGRDDMMSSYYQLVDFAISGNEILATSMVNLDSVWRTDYGIKALKVNREATRRGVSVRRIFIFSDEEKKRQAQADLEDQANVDVDVYTVTANQISIDHQRDFVMIVESVVIGYETGVDRDLVQATVSSRENDLKKYRAIWSEIKNVAVRFRPDKTLDSGQVPRDSPGT